MKNPHSAQRSTFKMLLLKVSQSEPYKIGNQPTVMRTQAKTKRVLMMNCHIH